MLDLLPLLEHSPAFAASGAYLVMRSRREQECCCPGQVEVAFPGGDCGHFGCTRQIAAHTSLVRTREVHGEPVCLPCALTLWGVSPDRADAQREETLRRARAATTRRPGQPGPPG